MEEADTLSAVLRSVRLTGALLFLVEAAAPWVTEAPRSNVFASVLLPDVQHVISYHIVTEGTCWAGLVGEPLVHCEPGDILVVPHGDAYLLASNQGMRADYGDAATLTFFREMARGKLPPVVSEGGGGALATRFLCGFLGCDLRPFNPVLSALPRMIHLRRPAQQEDRLDHLIAFTRGEIRDQRSGAQTVLLRLSELLFVELIRRYLRSLPGEQLGWFAALRDPLIGRALSLLHNRAAYGWTLAELANAVGSSRSALSDRFNHVVGQPPMQYLTQWRMQLAARLLSDGVAKVSAVASEVGYESEAAFSRAFKKTTGMAPVVWRKRVSDP